MSEDGVTRDTMDGGFAVVDRERIIEEEVHNVTPWYKHFINAFIEPSKMMEACFSMEPTKGASIGVVGGIIFSTIYVLVNLLNPINKAATYELLRASGVEEMSLDQSYSMRLIGGVFGGIIGFFFGVLVSAIVYQIIRMILRDKVKFGTLFKMLMVASMVAMSIQCVDAIISWIIGVSGNVFSVAWLLSEQTKATPVGLVLMSILTLPHIISIVYIAIGYKIITHTSLKKGILAVVINELLNIVLAYGIAIMTANMITGL